MKTGPSEGEPLTLLTNFRRHLLAAIAVLVCGLLASTATSATTIALQAADTAPDHVFQIFLDRLMVAESGGRRHAKNPRSSALGPYQFIKSTFLAISRRHLADEIAGLKEAQILELRSNEALARRAAAAFCQESLQNLKNRGLQPTFAHLRLAFLLGPAGAARIMLATNEIPVGTLLSRMVVKANPFMRGMRVGDLLDKAARDVSPDPGNGGLPASANVKVRVQSGLKTLVRQAAKRA